MGNLEIYIYIYMCVYICVYVCIYTHIHTHTHIYTNKIHQKLSLKQYLDICTTTWFYLKSRIQFSSVQSLSHVQLFVTP